MKLIVCFCAVHRPFWKGSEYQGEYSKKRACTTEFTGLQRPGAVKRNSLLLSMGWLQCQARVMWVNRVTTMRWINVQGKGKSRERFFPSLARRFFQNFSPTLEKDWNTLYILSYLQYGIALFLRRCIFGRTLKKICYQEAANTSCRSISSPLCSSTNPQ